MGGGLSSFLAGSNSVFILESVSLTWYHDGKKENNFVITRLRGGHNFWVRETFNRTLGHIHVFLTALLLVCSLGALRKPLDLQLLGSLEEGGQLLLGHVHLVDEREHG